MVIGGIAIGCCGASESRHRERYGSEEIAGVVVCRTATLLIGNAVIGSLHKKLSRSHYSDHRENTEGNIYSRAGSSGTKLTAENTVYHIGHLTAIASASTAATTATILDLGSENNRLYRFYDGSRVVIAYIIMIAHIAITVIGARGVRGDISFTAVKNHILLKCGDTLEGLASAYTETRLKLKKDVISDIYLIKSVVEWDLINTDIGANDLGTLGSHIARGGKYLLTVGGEIHTGILEAISVATAVENSLRVYAYRSAQILITAEGSISVFLHCNFSSFKVLFAHSTIKLMVCYIICRSALFSERRNLLNKVNRF